MRIGRSTVTGHLSFYYIDCLETEVFPSRSHERGGRVPIPVFALLDLCHQTQVHHENLLEDIECSGVVYFCVTNYPMFSGIKHDIFKKIIASYRGSKDYLGSAK